MSNGHKTIEVRISITRSKNYNSATASLSESFDYIPGEVLPAQLREKKMEIMTRLSKECEVMCNAIIVGSFIPE